MELHERYSRQMILPEMGEEGQKKLLDSKVVILGCGALGTNSANLLARAGVGRLVLVDRDIVEPGNLQRQVLFTEEDAWEAPPKALRAAERLRAVNSGIHVEGICTHAGPWNILSLLKGADLVLDASDNFALRFLLNEACLKLGIPWIFAAVLGNFGMTFNILPGESACYRCLVEKCPPPGSFQTCETAGVLGPVPAFIAALQAAEAIKCLAGKPEAMSRELLLFDAWQNFCDRVFIPRHPACPACAKKEWGSLGKGEEGVVTALLCARGAVEVAPVPPRKVDLEKLGERLKAVGKVTQASHVLHFEAEERRISVFEDGRAIIKGVRDEGQALALYARYVGM